ncbi:MAG: hypothetical protein QOK38_3627 [Acidobacteriaceae bacterium]|jgi:hypothetical protein|nr:hypothetical protein [Acidobacteriaceae bacterium]
MIRRGDMRTELVSIAGRPGLRGSPDKRQSAEPTPPGRQFARTFGDHVHAQRSAEVRRKGGRWLSAFR